MVVVVDDVVQLIESAVAMMETGSPRPVTPHPPTHVSEATASVVVVVVVTVAFPELTAQPPTQDVEAGPSVTVVVVVVVVFGTTGPLPVFEGRPVAGGMPVKEWAAHAPQQDVEASAAVSNSHALPVIEVGRSWRSWIPGFG